jgi:molybdenum cofactor cytidylyltransferase
MILALAGLVMIALQLVAGTILAFMPAQPPARPVPGALLRAVSPGPGRPYTGILLAAGAGSRFGGGKLLHPMPDGTPIGVAALRNLTQVFAQVVVVVRPGDAALTACFAREGVWVIECPEAVDGMGHSLAAAYAPRQSSRLGGGLGDMPRVARASAVIATLNAGARIAVPVYQGKRGHPVGFAASCGKSCWGCAACRRARRCSATPPTWWRWRWTIRASAGR